MHDSTSFLAALTPSSPSHMAPSALSRLIVFGLILMPPDEARYSRRYLPCLPVSTAVASRHADLPPTIAPQMPLLKPQQAGCLWAGV